MRKAAVNFTGCRLNRYESQVISESIESCGFEIVSFDDRADLYVINTCSVTQRAEASSRQMVRKARRMGPYSKIVVTGCYSDLKRKAIEQLGADLVIPNRDKENIRENISRLFKSDNIVPSQRKDTEFGSWVISDMGDLTRGYVKIQEGCDRRCTYCTIWKSRGPNRSRNPEYIIREANALRQNGYLEIVLTGVHIGMYLHDGLNLTGLLRTLLDKTDIPRIRLSSLYPTEADDELIDLMASNRRLCPWVHLSIQSGDDAILRLMGRDYNRRQIAVIIDKLKTSIHNITIGADIIVGFPGESDNAFRNTIELIERGGVNHLHVFSYSSRPDTQAANYGNQVPAAVRQERRMIVYEIGKTLKDKHLRSFVGKNLTALIERRYSAEPGILTGLTENYIRIQTTGSESLKGRLVTVHPKEVNGGVLISDIVIDQ